MGIEGTPPLSLSLSNFGYRRILMPMFQRLFKYSPALPPPSQTSPQDPDQSAPPPPPSLCTEIRIQNVSFRFYRNLLAIAKGNT